MKYSTSVVEKDKQFWEYVKSIDLCALSVWVICYITSHSNSVNLIKMLRKRSRMKNDRMIDCFMPFSDPFAKNFIIIIGFEITTCMN